MFVYTNPLLGLAILGVLFVAYAAVIAWEKFREK